jgi:outer membrane scaffolding protein for murein synthesis (MipA/OmpV family)
MNIIAPIRNLVVSILLVPHMLPIAVASADEFELVEKPRLEAGIGLGYFQGFDYPASNDPNTASLVLPFFIYRSEVFRFFDGGGVGAVAIEEPRVKLELSLGGALNAESEGNSAREGLPDLDLLLEVGPQLTVRIFDRVLASGGRAKLSWDSKIRAVVSTDFKGIDARGFVVASGFSFKREALFSDKVDFISNLDVTFADKRFNEYLYAVEPQYATQNRASYAATAGYVQTSVFLGFAFRPTEKLRIFTGVSTGLYGPSANKRSPLFETNQSTTYALGVVWTAFQSKDMIKVYDND